MWTLQRNSGKRHSRLRNLNGTLCTGDEESDGILWKMCLFMLKKLLQAIIVCTGKASGLLTGQEASMSTGLFIGTVI